MTNDDIAQKLALLPEGLAERNIQSWNKAVEDFGAVYEFHAEYCPGMFEMQEVAIAFVKIEQAKLFRAEQRAYNNLIISTTDGQVKIGDPYLILDCAGGVLKVQYGIDKEKYKYNVYKRISSDNYFESGEDAITFLQPMLDLLWDETRGKKNA